ncbi:MAG: rhodanese-like domain-containing protein [Armatimonadota bacterium]
MSNLLKLLPGTCCIVILAAGLGFTCNAIRSDGLPLVRKPLRETRAYATKAQMASNAPINVNNSKPVTSIPKITVAEAKKDSTASDAVDKEVKDSVTIAKDTRAVPITDETKPQGSIKQCPKDKTVSQAKPSQPHSQKKAEALFTTLDDAKTCFDKKGAVFLDGRAAIDYRSEHITGAISLFCEEFDELYEQVLGSIPKDRLIITYCSDPECTEAIKLADTLVAKGHTRVVILLEGLPGWKDAGYPTSTGKEPG